MKGILLLCALILYQLKLKQGQSVYYSTYKITWIIFTAYLSVSFFMASGEYIQGLRWVIRTSPYLIERRVKKDGQGAWGKGANLVF